MSNPLKNLFGGGQGPDPTQQMMQMLMMQQMMKPQPAPANPASKPVGTPSGITTASSPGQASFASAAAPPPSASQTPGKTLLGS